MKEIIFAVVGSPQGGFEANALGESVYTEAETWQELRENIIEAASCHFDDKVKRVISLHFERRTDKISLY